VKNINGSSVDLLLSVQQRLLAKVSISHASFGTQHKRPMRYKTSAK